MCAEQRPLWAATLSATAGHAGQLFEAQAVVDRRHRGAAVGLGELDAHQPERGHLRHEQVGRGACASSHSMTCGPISASANSRTLRRSTC